MLTGVHTFRIVVDKPEGSGLNKEISMNQSEFYNTPEVKQAIEVQKQNPYGSAAHKAAHEAIGDAARKYGVWEQYISSHGDAY